MRHGRLDAEVLLVRLLQVVPVLRLVLVLLLVVVAGH